MGRSVWMQLLYSNVTSISVMIFFIVIRSHDRLARVLKVEYNSRIIQHQNRRWCSKHILSDQCPPYLWSTFNETFPYLLAIKCIFHVIYFKPYSAIVQDTVIRGPAESVGLHATKIELIIDITHGRGNTSKYQFQVRQREMYSKLRHSMCMHVCIDLCVTIDLFQGRPRHWQSMLM